MELIDIRGKRCFELKTAEEALTLIALTPRSESFCLTPEETRQLFEYLKVCRFSVPEDAVLALKGITFYRKDKTVNFLLLRGFLSVCLKTGILKNKDSYSYVWCQMPEQALEPVFQLLQKWLPILRSEECLAPVFGLGA